MIGLIFGETNFPLEILKKIKKRKLKYLIIDLSKSKRFKNDKNSHNISIGNRNYLQGLNLIGLRRANFNNKDILGLNEAYKEIFATKNLTDNISKLNGVFKENSLVKNVIEFITKDKKRSICTPFSKE